MIKENQAKRSSFKISEYCAKIWSREGTVNM